MSSERLRSGLWFGLGLLILFAAGCGDGRGVDDQAEERVLRWLDRREYGEVIAYFRSVEPARRPGVSEAYWAYAHWGRAGWEPLRLAGKVGAGAGAGRDWRGWARAIEGVWPELGGEDWGEGLRIARAACGDRDACAESPTLVIGAAFTGGAVVRAWRAGARAAALEREEGLFTRANRPRGRRDDPDAGDTSAAQGRIRELFAPEAVAVGEELAFGLELGLRSPRIARRLLALPLPEPFDEDGETALLIARDSLAPTLASVAHAEGDGAFSRLLEAWARTAGFL